MTKSPAELASKRRQWVNSEYSKQVSGKQLSRREQSKIFKSLWKKAKSNIK